MKTQFSFHIDPTKETPLLQIVCCGRNEPSEGRNIFSSGVFAGGPFTRAYLIGLILSLRMRCSMGDRSTYRDIRVCESPLKCSDWIRTIRNAQSRGANEAAKSGDLVPRMPVWHRELWKQTPSSIDFFRYHKKGDEQTIMLDDAWVSIDAKVLVPNETGVGKNPIDIAGQGDVAIVELASRLLQYPEKNSGWQRTEIDPYVKSINLPKSIIDANLSKMDVNLEQKLRQKASLLDLELAKVSGTRFPLSEAPLADQSIVTAKVAELPVSQQFDHLLRLFGTTLDNSEWFALLNDRTRPDFQRAMLTAQIGTLHGRKEKGTAPRALNPIPDDSIFLLESTWQVFWYAERNFKELRDACSCLISALLLLDADEASFGKADTAARNNAIDRILLFVRGEQLYLFLLWVTYMVIDRADATYTERLKVLVSKNHLFYLLNYYPAGINNRFIAFHRNDTFNRVGEQFVNKYWQTDLIAEGDTLFSIYSRNYKTRFATEREFIMGLIKSNNVESNNKIFPKGFDPYQNPSFDLNRPISEIPGVSLTREIVIGPPAKQQANYTTTKDVIGEWVDTPAGAWLLKIPAQWKM